LRSGGFAQPAAAGLSAVLLLLAGFPTGSIERSIERSVERALQRPATVTKPQPSQAKRRAAAAKPGAGPKPVVKTRAKPAARTQPEAAGFGGALAEEYAEYVRREQAKRYPGFRAKHFLAKARRAAGARPVAPEDPGALGIAGADRVALAEARSRLVAALERSARGRLPALAAKAQAKFDCWTERTRGGFARNAILTCRDQYTVLIALLEEAVMPLPGGSRFTRALTREYLAYAEYEARVLKDWIDSRHFARKGLRAASAKHDDAVPPEQLTRWNLHSRRDVPTFAAYRERLVAAFAAGARARLPAQSAIAQARFDCWVERTAERAEAAAVEKCRREFLTALQTIEAKPVRAQPRAGRPKPGRTDSAGLARLRRLAQLGRAAQLGRVAPAAGAWTIHFGFDQAALGAGEAVKIQRAARAARARATARVTVTGHADRAGAPGYNTGLSLRRAAAVRAALIRAGVAPARIRIFARGEVDGVGRANNRRVTIRLR
jgi:OOP family OmpA-OmpF porin